MGALTHNGDVITGLPSTASQINYDNTSSGMAATQVQAAVDELKSGLTGKVSSASRGYIDAESSVTIPISGGYRGLLVTDGIALSQHGGMYLVASNSSGESIGVADVKSCTAITVTGSSGQLTIANSYNGQASYNLITL